MKVLELQKILDKFDSIAEITLEMNNHKLAEIILVQGRSQYTISEKKMVSKVFIILEREGD